MSEHRDLEERMRDNLDDTPDGKPLDAQNDGDSYDPKALGPTGGATEADWKGKASWATDDGSYPSADNCDMGA